MAYILGYGDKTIEVAGTDEASSTKKGLMPSDDKRIFDDIKNSYVFIGAKVQDLEFGSVASNTAAGSKSFAASLVDGTDYFIVVAIGGAYGNLYSTSWNHDTKKIQTNAMNLSNGTHSLTVRVLNICFKKID